MSTINCDDGCTIKLDTDQIIDLYGKLSVVVKADLDLEYKQGKISGPTYAETYARLMEAIIQGSLSAVVGIQTKETAMDRCVKQEQCDSSKATTVRNDELADKDIDVKDEQISSSKSKTSRDDDVADEQIDASQTKSSNESCMATADCALKSSQKAKFDFETSNILPEQQRLTKRQIIGFDDNKTLKGFNAGMSAWGLAFSSGLLDAIPTFVTSDSLSATYTFLNSTTSV